MNGRQELPTGIPTDAASRTEPNHAGTSMAWLAGQTVTPCGPAAC